MATSQPEAPARKLRWFQYSLRSLMLLVLVVSLGMSWFAVKMKRAREQEKAVEEITRLGWSVAYDYQLDKRGGWVSGAVPPGPAWVWNLLGEKEGFFATVVFVDLSSCSVTDAGLEHLKGLTQLRTLILDSTKVTDAGLEHLKGLTQLQELYLEQTQVTDAGLEHLEGLTQLHYVELLYTRVTDKGVKRLQHALPKCMILS
jgi:hypothetical protein